MAGTTPYGSGLAANDMASSTDDTTEPKGVELGTGERMDKKRPATGDLGSDTDPGYSERKVEEGEAFFRRLGWKRLTVVLIVNAIALGSLSLPAAFATLGMVAGVISCVGVGLLAIYTSHIIGLVKLLWIAGSCTLALC